MHCKLNVAAIALMVVASIACYGQSSPANPLSGKSNTAEKARKASSSSVEEEIQSLRQELERQASQIESLKSGMAEKDEQLKKAQQAATEARAAAARAEAAATAQQQAVTENSAAVTTLQTTVTTLKGSQETMAAKVTEETTKIKKSIESPTVLHYKSITLTPGGFLEGDTVFRAHATGGDIATGFSAIPYEHADSYSLSEFYGSASASRLSLMMEGKVSWGTIRGYYETDFLGSGATSSNNQSNSYLLRQRLLYAQAETNSHLSFTVGQLWTLATEDKKGITSPAADVPVPMTADPNYMPGFVWTRQYALRVVKSFSKAAVAIAAENPQVIYAATLAGNTPYAVLGSAGLNAGAFNAAISSCSPSTSIVNYTNELDSNGYNVAVPVYKTVNSCANLANISFNEAPDLLVKAAFDPGFGHYEIFGVSRFAHETVYPGETTNGNLYGGFYDVNCPKSTPGCNPMAPALTTAGAFTSRIALGGLGASMRIPLLSSKLSLGAKGIYGPGVGRYGASNLADVTANASGRLVPIHNFSGLLTGEYTVTPRLVLVTYYGGDYASRTASSGGLTLAAPTAAQSAAGAWGGHWAAPTAAAVGYGSPLLSNSACNVTANPGYNGSSTGFYPGGSCGAQTRAVQEMAGGYWYDFYKGDRGRLRQGIQYGYIVREAWSGAGTPGIGAKGINNMFFTTLRYTLP
jgi:type II secretory pathway pseudopilin PulG